MAFYSCKFEDTVNKMDRVRQEIPGIHERTSGVAIVPMAAAWKGGDADLGLS